MPLARVIASTRELAPKSRKETKRSGNFGSRGRLFALYCFNTRGERSRTVTSSSVIECSVKKNCDGALGLGRAAIGVVMGPG
jgi:hypothetical protein